MQSAGIYRFEEKRKYLLYGMAKIKMGARIAVDPFIWFEMDVSNEVVLSYIKRALSQNYQVLSNPENWATHTKEFLNKLGIKKEKELYDGSKYVEIARDEGMLTFYPHCKSEKGGFVGIKGQKINIREDCGAD